MDYSKVKTALDRKPQAAPAPRVGYRRAIQQAALVDAPAALIGIPEMVARGASKLALGEDVLGTELSQRARAGLERAYGPDYARREQMTTGERLAGDVTTGALTAVPFALATGGGGLALPAMQVLGGATGGLGAGIAEEMGFGPVGQFIGGMAGGMTPSAIGRLPVVGTMTRGAGRRAKNLIPGMATREAQREAAGVLRQAVGGTDELVDSAGAAITAELDDVDRAGRATLGQVLGDEHPGGLAVTRMQKELARNPTLQGAVSLDQQLAERSQANLAALRQAESNLYPIAPEVAGPAAGAGLQAASERARAGVSRLYDQARAASAGAPPVPVAGIVGRAAELSDEASAFLKSRLPGEVAEIADRFQGGTASLDDLDNLSKSLNQTMADLSRSGDKIGYGIAAQLKKAVGDTYDELAAAGGQAGEAVAPLQAARAAHAAAEETYGLSHPAIKAFLQRSPIGFGTEPRNKVNLLAALRQGGTTHGVPNEATRLVRALADDPQALEGARRLAWMEILGSKPMVATPEGHAGAAIQTALRNLSDPATARSMRVLLGDDLYDSSLKLLRRTRQLTYGREGTRGSLYQTGSSIASAENSAIGALALDVATHGAAGMVSKLVNARSASKAFYDRTTALQRVQFLEKALLDPAYARFLLQVVKPKDLAQWNQRFELLKGGLESGAAGVRAAGMAGKE